MPHRRRIEWRRVIRDFRAAITTPSLPSGYRQTTTAVPQPGERRREDDPGGSRGSAGYRRTRKIKRRNSPEGMRCFPFVAAGGLLQRRYKESDYPSRRYSRTTPARLHHLPARLDLAWPGQAWPADARGSTCNDARARLATFYQPPFSRRPWRVISGLRLETGAFRVIPLLRRH